MVARLLQPAAVGAAWVKDGEVVSKKRRRETEKDDSDKNDEDDDDDDDSDDTGRFGMIVVSRDCFSSMLKRYSKRL
jgi:hypothetical protein